MKTDIHKHLFGIYSIFSARIKLINGSIGHNSTQGAETESDVRNLLADFLPTNYGIGSGIIIDTEGNSSKQIDIIIFDKNRGNYTLSANSKIFLADYVVAAIEIKTTFTTGQKSSLEGALSNIASVKKMRVCSKKWNGTEFNQETNQLEFKEYTPTTPLGIVFFFQEQETQKALNIDDFFDNLKSAIDTIPIAFQPDLLFSLDHASFFRHSDIGKREKPAEYSSVLVPLDKDQSKVANIDGLTDKTKAMVNFSHLDFSEGRALQSKQIDNEKGTANIQVLTGINSLNLDPLIYRVSKIKGKYYLLDKVRAFLNFVWVIEKLVSMKQVNQRWTLADYFGESFFLSSNYPNDFK